MQPRPTARDIQDARDRWPGLKAMVQWEGPAPAWSDLGCRGCWDIIHPGQPAVECGVGAFHRYCFDLVTEGDTR